MSEPGELVMSKVPSSHPNGVQASVRMGQPSFQFLAVELKFSLITICRECRNPAPACLPAKGIWQGLSEEGMKCHRPTQRSEPDSSLSNQFLFRRRVKFTLWHIIEGIWVAFWGTEAPSTNKEHL